MTPKSLLLLVVKTFLWQVVLGARRPCPLASAAVESELGTALSIFSYLSSNTMDGAFEKDGSRDPAGC